MRYLHFALLGLLLPYTSGKSYEESVAHMPAGCPTFESWRLSQRCAYAYESKDCSGHSIVLNVNETVKPKPHQPNSVNFLLVRPGCEVGVWGGSAGWGIGAAIFQFPQPVQYESIDCKCRTDDLKALMCTPRRKLIPLGNCTSRNGSQTSCSYYVKAGVFKIGEKTEVGRKTKELVLERVCFYQTFNGTDQVITVDDAQQCRGNAVGVLSLGDTAPGREETVALWQVSYTCGGYHAFIAKTLLTVETQDTDTERNDIAITGIKKVARIIKP